MEAADNAGSEEQGPPWPFWGSLGWMFALTGLLVAAQVLAVVVQFVFRSASSAMTGSRTVPSFEMDATTLCLSQGAAVLAVVPAAWWLAHLARTGRTPGYLAFRPFRWRPFLGGLGGVVVVGLFSGFVVTEENDVMMQIFRDAGSPPLLWFTVSVLAPIAEEVVFRGFVFEGLARGRGGAVTASLFTSLVWSLIHLQYSWREMSVIFLLGLVLGWVRHRSGSVWACMALHAVNNAFSCGAMEWELRHGGAGR